MKKFKKLRHISTPVNAMDLIKKEDRKLMIQAIAATVVGLLVVGLAVLFAISPIWLSR